MSDAKPKGPRAKAGARPVRPKRLFERPWPWMILAGLLGGAVVTLALSMLESAQDSGGDPDQAFLAIASVGSFAVVLMVLVALYSARKRRRALQEHLPGTMMVWLKAHVWMGLLAAFAVLVHWWLYPMNARISTGKIALVVLLILVLSGIAWRIVYQTVPKRVAAKVGNLSVKDTRSRLEQIEVEIEKAIAGSSDLLRQLVELRLAGVAAIADLDAQAASLSVEEQGTWAELKALAERRDRYRGREPKQERYHKLLQRWKVAHLPLAVILGVVVAIHIFDVLGVTKKVFANEADEFPSSAQCADCHSEIVREWSTAVHSVAQTSATTVAQTALALKEDPAIGQICTNCHAPIGTILEPSDTFPLPGEDGGAEVLSEGVTCWTCHTVSEIPGEGRGAGDLFPVARAGTRSFGTVFNPPMPGDPPLPVPEHQVDVGFFSDPVEGTYQLCGACHNVKVDLDGDGFSPVVDELGETSGLQGEEAATSDLDEDGVLDENELEEIDDDGDGVADLDVDGSTKIEDLVLQTTFDEWEDFVQSTEFQNETCQTCHMPDLGVQPTVDDAPGPLSIQDRPRHAHTFVGVDYDLSPGHYAGLGIGGEDALGEVLTARDLLISSAVTITPEVLQRDVSRNALRAVITVRANVLGHDFPTGFAFARQWWLEVSAETVDGEQLCLLPVNPGTGLIDRQNGIPTPGCSSGAPPSGGDWSQPGKAAEDLLTCDPRQVADTFRADFAAAGKLLKNENVSIAAAAALTDCDPWLANFQKILTDGDPDDTGQFVEVPYQSLEPDIVKLQARVADQQTMGALKPYDNPQTPEDDRQREFAYVFDVSGVRGQDVIVKVQMHLRHLPPYFLKALDGFYPDGLTGDRLLQQMIVSSFGQDETEPIQIPA